MNNFSPQVNSGLPPLNITPGFLKPLSLFSSKKIVSSSKPARERRGVMEQDISQLEREIDQFEADITNNPINKLIE